MFRSRNPKKSSQASPTKAQSKLGLYKDGLWYCDCEPRRRARNGTVQQNNDNRGRKCTKAVWACPLDKNNPKSCRFFLWESDALTREGKKFQQSVPPSTPSTPSRSFTQQTLKPGFLTPSSSVKKPVQAIIIDENDFEDDAEIGAQVFSDEQLTPTKKRRTSESVLTPQVSQRKPMVTPGKTPKDSFGGSFDGSFGGPSSSVKDSESNIFDTPAVNKNSTALFKRPSIPPSQVISSSPTPGGPVYTGLATPSRISKRKYEDVGSEMQLDLVSEVMGLLDTAHDVTVPNNVKYELEAILRKHMMQKEGYLKGRDVARQALEKRGNRIKELENEQEKLLKEKERLEKQVDALTMDMDKMCAKLQTTSLSHQAE